MNAPYRLAPAMTLAQFFARIAPVLHTTAPSLLAYAEEDRIGGYDPHNPGGWIIGSVWENEGKALYAIVRALKPARVLELGTRRGCSSTHLLSALAANGTGELVSLDIAPFEGDIPAHLRERWTFVQGDALDWLDADTSAFDLIFEDCGHNLDFNRACISACAQRKPKLLISHDAEHPSIFGAEIKQAWTETFGANGYQTARIDPSDCGFAWRVFTPESTTGNVVRLPAPFVPVFERKPLLSVVSGTFNRLDSLRTMVASVRENTPPGIGYEIVLVDGGSTDGTIDWASRQADVRLIAQGELLGAIRAFSDGAAAARGQFVVMANDDIQFAPGSLLAALAHLDAHPEVGAVAFGDDRPAPNKQMLDDTFGVQYVPAQDADGSPINVIYAQVGMFRKALGDAAGWWGADDEVMREAWTYGGDNYLSARLWEMGFVVVAVPGAVVVDRHRDDALRERNTSHDAALQSPYHRRFPLGARLGSKPYTGARDREHLRVLLATLYEPGHGMYKSGLRSALSKVARVVECDWVRDKASLLAYGRDWQPHLVITQMCDPDLMHSLRASIPPDAVIVNWYGDVHESALLGDAMLRQSRDISLQLVVNADVIPEYAARGLKAAYWQIGFEPVPEALPDVPAHDILFLANAYAPSRRALEPVLRKLSKSTGLYGVGWQKADGMTLYNFVQGAALYRKSRIAIGDNMYGSKGFVSNRLFEALANGAFLLHQAIPGLEELTGLVDGVHYASWTDVADLKTKARYWLKHADERKAIAAAGEAFVRANHNFDVRVRELFELIEAHCGHDQPVERAEQLVPVGAGGEWMD